MASADQHPMRGPRLWSLLLLVLLTSCLQVEQTITIAGDGSGTQAVKLSLREALLQDLARTASANAAGVAADPQAVFDEARVRKELEADGLELTAHTVRRDGGRRSVELTARFSTFAELSKSPFCGSAAEWALEPGPKPGTTRLTLYPQGRSAWLDARAKAARMRDEVDVVAADFFGRKQRELEGLDVVLRFRLPGDVLLWTANMEKTGDREVTARITADQIKTPEDLVRRLAPRFELVFDSSGTSLPRK